MVPVLLLAATGTIVASQNVIRVRSTTTCPTAIEIEGQLAPLLSGLSAPRAPDRADVDSVEGGGLSVRIFRSDGTPVIERRLERLRSCSEAAQAAAVVIAAWEAAHSVEVPAQEAGVRDEPPKPAVQVRPTTEKKFELGLGLSAAWADEQIV